MSKMRIKKHKGVKLTETRHPPPRKDGGEDEEEKLLQCIMCNCMTIEEYLKRHIRYNHLISKDEIIDRLYNLHYPPESVSVSTQTSTVSITEPPNDTQEDSEDPKKPISKGRGRSDQAKGPEDDEEVLCPACGDVEDGTPMVACAVCDSWYHFVCVGLESKPVKGSEWLCTSCSGKPGPSSRGRRRVVEAKAGSPEADKTKKLPSRRRSAANGTNSSDDIEPKAKVKNDEVVKKKVGPKSKTQPTIDYTNHPEFSDDDHEEAVNDDLHYSDDSVQDKDFEPQESDYDEKDMQLSPGAKLGSVDGGEKTRKQVRISGPPSDDEYDDLSRDDLRKLCQKELINATGSRADLVSRLKSHYRKVEETAQTDSKQKAKKYKLTEMTSGDGLCKICGLGWELPDDLELGPLYKYGACTAHLHCLMFSSGLIQGGDETEGIVGFMPPDVDRECERGAKLKCCFCREIYATVGCCQRTCMKTYHLPCGIKFGALNEYYGNFDSYCPSHRSKREVKPQKSKSKNYVLTDLGLVPEHVDREAGFDSEKYKDMLRKIEKQYGEKKKTKEGEVKKEPDATARKKREPYDEKLEEIKTRPGPKSKTILMRKKKFDEEEDANESAGQSAKKKKPSTSPVPSPKAQDGEGVRRGGRERKPFGSDIYKSAKEELEAMLKKKEFVNLSDTFTNLAGTRRATKSVYNKALGEEEEEEDSYASKRSAKGRSAKRAMVEVDDEDDEEDFVSKRQVRTAPAPRKNRKSPHSDSEEEDSNGFRKIMKKKKSRGAEKSSEEDEPVQKSPIRSIRIKPMPERKSDTGSEEDSPRTESWSAKVLTPEPEERHSDEDRPRRKRKTTTPDKTDSEETPRRKPGPKSRKVLTPECTPDEERLPRGRKIRTPQPKMSDSEEEGLQQLRNSRSRKKEPESIESIKEFLVDSKKDSDSGLGKKIKLTKVKKHVGESGDEESGTPPILENEFEDTEPDNIHENLTQNDGFVDSSTLSSANASDEGAEIEKPNFNDDDDEDNLDLSDLLTKLDVQIHDNPWEASLTLIDDKSWRNIDNCSRFKCKICGLDDRDQEKLEEHIKTVHHKKIPGKMLKRQEMTINVERKCLSTEEKMILMRTYPRKRVKSMEGALEGQMNVLPKENGNKTPGNKKKKITKEDNCEPFPTENGNNTITNKSGKKKTTKEDKNEPFPAELTGEQYPFFKYANDDVTEIMAGKGAMQDQCKIKGGKDKTEECDRKGDDNIDSLLDESDESPAKSRGRPRAKQIAKDENDGKNAKKKTTVGKDFVLWENDIKSSRSSRSSRIAEEGSSGRSSRQSITSSQKDSSKKDDGCHMSSNRELTPESVSNETNSDTKEDEPLGRRRRKSPPKKVVDDGRGELSPVPSATIAGPIFECLKCGTKMMQRKDLVMNHLKVHKLTFESYIDVYLEENSSSQLSAVIDWRAEDQPTKNEDLFNSLMAECPSLPPHLGPKLGKAEPEDVEAGGPKLGSTSLLSTDVEEKDKSSKFKVLHSTLHAGDSQPNEDPLSSALSSILSEEEKQELILSPIKKTLKSAGIEVGESEDNFVLRVKLSKH